MQKNGWMYIFQEKNRNLHLHFIQLVQTFRQAVWQILLQIPYGQTITYGEIARQMSEIQNTPHMSAQAVGGAVGHNEISIIIPCHRVVGYEWQSDGIRRRN